MTRLNSSEPDWWPSDYFASRDHFIHTGKTCAAQMESHQVSALGPAGEALSVDVASITSAADEHTIILCSGVHGIEGFIGASVQIQTLQMLANTGGLPEKTGIVMIHAANPWGFAHLRRVNEHNVDVNRNFYSAVPQSHPGYAGLDSVINPPKAPDPRGDFKYWMNAAKLIAQNRGVAKLFKPIAEGQYDFPQGVFFGGKQVSESCTLLKDLVLEYSSKAKRVSILDVHSGLGPKATASLIGNSNIGLQEGQLEWISDHYAQPFYIDSTTTNAYNANGTFSQWCSRTLSDKEFMYLCIEIGTVNPIKLFSALRRENQAHHWADGDSAVYRKTKLALLNAFAPKSQAWRDKSTDQGLHVVRKTLELPA